MKTSLIRRRISWPFIILPIILFVQSCEKSERRIDIAAYTQGIEKWKEQRLTRLKAEDGWLTLAGLFWLKEGENKMGSDSSNAIIFPPGKAPRFAGSLSLEKSVVRLKAPRQVGIRYKDSLVTSLLLQLDEEGLAAPSILNLGTLSFYIIKRGENFAVRVKDKENPPRLNFRGLEYFPIDPKWRIEAKFEPYDPPRKIPITTMVGTVQHDSCPGALVFRVDGKTHRLDAVIERGAENRLFIMFKDGTNEKETYRLGRQLYTDLPDDNGKVILDFNKAYNWPCVFTDYAVCPIPPTQNHLPVRVEAGEKDYQRPEI